MDEERNKTKMDTMEDVKELLDGLELQCSIDGHEWRTTLHQGPARFVLYFVCPGCGYREVELMCEPMARRVMQKGATGWSHEMDGCCGATYLWSELTTWEAL